MPRDFYAVLGVPRNATSEQIRDRFLQLTREKHPDRFTGAQKQQAELAFQDITEAFNILSSPARRREHDTELLRSDSQRTASGHDPVQLAKVYLQRGVKAYKAKNYLEAADNFDRATNADPNNAMAWHHLARACAHHERWLQRAAAAIARACELDPMKPDYQKLAGTIFAPHGRQGEGAAPLPPGDSVGWRRPRDPGRDRGARGQAQVPSRRHLR